MSVLLGAINSIFGIYKFTKIIVLSVYNALSLYIDSAVVKHNQREKKTCDFVGENCKFRKSSVTVKTNLFFKIDLDKVKVQKGF